MPAAAPLVAYVLCAIFFVAGFVHYLGLGDIPARFQQWGLARWWHVPTGLVEIGGAVLLAVPQTRPLGFAVLLLTAGVLAVAMVRARAFRQSAAPLLVATVLAASMHIAIV